jgi:hypothetical protein
MSRCAASNGKAKAAEKWLERVEKMSLLLRKGRRSGGYDRVRIAILDTGIDSCYSYWASIKGYKDFVSEGNEQGRDNTGHGTNGVHLFFKILPEADIFVARVFEEAVANDVTTLLMAKVSVQQQIVKWTFRLKIDRPFNMQPQSGKST